MTDVVLQLIGGPLDGLYLPVTPRAATPPRQLIVFSPLNETWTNYTDHKRRGGATDVYKLRSGVRLATSPPAGLKVINMSYEGVMSPEAAKIIEDMARDRMRGRE